MRQRLLAIATDWVQVIRTIAQIVAVVVITTILVNAFWTRPSIEALGGSAPLLALGAATIALTRIELRTGNWWKGVCNYLIGLALFFSAYFWTAVETDVAPFSGRMLGTFWLMVGVIALGAAVALLLIASVIGSMQQIRAAVPPRPQDESQDANGHNTPR